MPFYCHLTADGATSAPGARCGIFASGRRDNSVSGDALLEDTSRCCVYSNRGLVATLGIRDLVIVNTQDALLVADKNRAQDVSQIVRRLKQSNRREHAQHLRNLRPWGYFESLNAGTRFQVKLLNVKAPSYLCKCIITGPNIGLWSMAQPKSSSVTPNACCARTRVSMFQPLIGTGSKIRERSHCRLSKCKLAAILPRTTSCVLTISILGLPKRTTN